MIVRVPLALGLGLLAMGGAGYPAPPALAFDCVETKCPAISTCAEAYYKFKVCGHFRRDGDDNGIPCENVCGDDPDTFRQRVFAQWPKDMAPLNQEAFGTGLLDALAPPANAEPAVAPEFACTGKRKCGQMASCDEAMFYLKTCGVKRLDGDGDGVACNSLCRGR